MKSLSAILAAAALAVSPAPSLAQAVKFTVVNNTDVTFTGMQFRRFGTQQWHPLTVVPLPVTGSGGRGTADFSDPDCAFDLQATLPDGRTVVWSAVNLCEARVVTLNRTPDGVLWVDYR